MYWHISSLNLRSAVNVGQKALAMTSETVVSTTIARTTDVADTSVCRPSMGNHALTTEVRTSQYTGIAAYDDE